MIGVFSTTFSMENEVYPYLIFNLFDIQIVCFRTGKACRIYRKNINQDHQQSIKVGDQQTDGDANRRQVIKKQNAVSSTISLKHTLVALSEDFKYDMI